MAWLQRLWNTLRPTRVERDINRELAFHLAERIDQLRAEGLSAEEATRLARWRFGNVAVQAERTRDMDISVRLDALLRDSRYAIRALARMPAFTITALLTLGLGIGANSTVFSAIDVVLLHPLPFPNGDRLMQLRQIQERSAETNIAPTRLEDWNRLNHTFDAITGYYREDVSETSGDLPERIRRAWVTPRFLDVWGVAPAAGRGFTLSEHRVGGSPAVLISDRYWRRRFNRDPAVLGQLVRIGSQSFPIIGAMPSSFYFPDREVDLWFPSAIDNKNAQSRQATWYTGIGRLKADVTLEQARANLTAVQALLADQYGGVDARLGVEVVPLKEVTVGGVRRSLLLLFAAVSILLLITCTNVAALLVARASHRQQEIALRLSLGASRGAVAAQMLTETLILSVAGSAIGLVIAAAATAALRVEASDLPRMDEIALDGRILLYTLASTMLVALFCGLLPALRIVRDDGVGALTESGRTQVSTRTPVQWLLVGSQVALSVTLLAGAAFLVRSLQELWRVDPGFETHNVLTFRISGNYAETGDYDRLIQRIDGTLEQLSALPGIEAAATTMMVPGVPAENEVTFEFNEGRSEIEPRIVAESRIVSPEYFATMRIPLLEGELCRRRPRGTVYEVMVNRLFVARFLSGRSSPLGVPMKIANNPTPGRIVGVVADSREQGLDRDPSPTVYACASAPNPTPHFLVRTQSDPLPMAEMVRHKIKELEPLRSVYGVAALSDRIGSAFKQHRLRTAVLVLFAVSALSLSSVGLYGTLSYVVTMRRREIALRLALGARRSGIIRQFLEHSFRVVGVACMCGLLLSIAFSRVLTGMLYGVSSSDPFVLSAVVAIVLGVAALAALLPATRAALLEPMRVLREP